MTLSHPVRLTTTPLTDEVTCVSCDTSFNSIFVIALCITLCVGGLPVTAANHYLARDGNDADAGTKERPWQTLERASQGLQPGDTLTIRPGTYTGTLTISGQSPADEPLTVRCEPRRSAVLAAGDEEHAIQIANAANVRIEGLVLRPHNYEGGWVRIDQSSHVTIDDCLMERSSGPCPFRVTDASDLALTRSVLREYQGHNMTYISDSQRLVLEGNAFSRAGHALLLLLPDRSNSDVVIRGNIFHPNYGRSVLLDSVNNLLFEDNVITRSYDGGRSADSRIGFYATRGICRYNRFYDNWGTKLVSVSPYRETLDFNTVRFYNNVIADNSATGIRVWGEKETVTRSLFLNNALTGNDPYGSKRQIRVGSGGADDVRFASNAVNGMVQIGDELMTATAADQISENDQFADNYEMEPEFEDPSRHLYAPAENSPLIDAGRVLTHAVGSGSGADVSVQDAAYFFDGFGIADQPGDTIVIGDTPAVVRAADIENNTLTLDREVQWADGDAVSLPYSGSAPDIGAYETGDSGRPRVEIVPGAGRVQAGEAVTMTLRTFGDIAPQSIGWLLGDGTVATGTQVEHAYDEPYDYPVRVAVTDDHGRVHWGTAVIQVADPDADPDVLMHTTFDDPHGDWWWRWQTYRPGKTAWKLEECEGASGLALHMWAPADGQYIPCRTHPREWNVNEYPFIHIRYRIAPETPVALRLEGFRTASGARDVWVAATETALPLSGEPQALDDDGQWHTLTIDARVLQEAYPEVEIAQSLYFEAPSQHRDRVKEGQGFWLDEVIITATLP